MLATSTARFSLATPPLTPRTLRRRPRDSHLPSRARLSENCSAAQRLAGTADRILSGLTLARAESLTALLRSAQSRDSLVARLPRPARTLSAFPPSLRLRKTPASRLTHENRRGIARTPAWLPHGRRSSLLGSPVLLTRANRERSEGQSRTRTSDIRTRARTRGCAPLQLRISVGR